MDPATTPARYETQAVGLLPWHRPEVQRLVVKLDTGAGGASFVDGPGSEGPVEVLPSDRRLKKDISKLTDALNGILALTGVSYRYKVTDYPELGLSGSPQIGFIAQELEQVFPELVETRPDGFKAVNYAQLVPVLAEAIKEQQSMIAELQEQVNQLQEKAQAGEYS